MVVYGEDEDARGDRNGQYHGGGGTLTVSVDAVSFTQVCDSL